jgi:hypothetical protein
MCLPRHRWRSIVISRRNRFKSLGFRSRLAQTAFRLGAAHDVGISEFLNLNCQQTLRCGLHLHALGVMVRVSRKFLEAHEDRGFRRDHNVGQLGEILLVQCPPVGVSPSVFGHQLDSITYGSCSGQSWPIPTSRRTQVKIHLSGNGNQALSPSEDRDSVIRSV